MDPTTYRAVTSRMTPGGVLEVGVAEFAMPSPRANQVMIRVEAVPLNPSDVGFLTGPGDVATARAVAGGVAMDLKPGAAEAFAARMGQAVQLGAEGAGVVVDAGEEALHLVGKRVSLMVGRMLAQYRVIDAAQVIEVPEAASWAEAAAMHGNPLTVLGMIETMRRDGFSGIVHTAAASNVGRILVSACRADGVPLVNVVRRPEQVELLRALGATHVIDASQPDFKAALEAAVGETRAALLFDATGGGRLAGDVLAAMERAIPLTPETSVRTAYGQTIRKQAYVYGSLDRSPTILDRQAIGQAWSVAGWMMNAEQVGGQARFDELRARIARELTTTFTSHFAREVGFAELLTPQVLQAVSSLSTGGKHLVRPHG